MRKTPRYIAVSDTVYSDVSNTIIPIIPKSVKKTDIKFSVSQGRLTEDNLLYSLDSLSNGFVDVTLIKKSENLILEKRRLVVITSPKQQLLDENDIYLNFSLNGYKAGKIPNSVIKKVNKISINPGYGIISATVYIASTNVFCSEPLMLFLKSEFFDSEMLRLIKKLQPKNLIIFDQVIFTDELNRQFAFPKNIVFEIVD